jgi:hypothetical protein
MPIRPENKDRYPPDWPQIRDCIRERARYCCEGSPDFPDCRVRHGAWGHWQDGVFVTVSKRGILDVLKPENPGKWIRPPLFWAGHKIIEIVLTIGHLDHTPENCDPGNLRAWCQRCHLNYDAAHHAQTRYHTRRDGRALEMFPTETTPC